MVQRPHPNNKKKEKKNKKIEKQKNGEKNNIA
jgi:hypothetical protein